MYNSSITCERDEENATEGDGLDKKKDKLFEQRKGEKQHIRVRVQQSDVSESALCTENNINAIHLFMQKAFKRCL